jgi:hypothetical protein
MLFKVGGAERHGDCDVAGSLRRLHDIDEVDVSW